MAPSTISDAPVQQPEHRRHRSRFAIFRLKSRPIWYFIGCLTVFLVLGVLLTFYTVQLHREARANVQQCIDFYLPYTPDREAAADYCAKKNRMKT